LPTHFINDTGLFVIEDHKDYESDRRYNCHPGHEFEHKVFLLSRRPY